MKNHGTVGTPGYLFWGGLGQLNKRYEGADFLVFHGSWDVKPTHDQYHGLAERRKDCRYINC